jgi:hypothetical protein
MATNTPVFAGADIDGVGFHCYVFGERPDEYDPETGEILKDWQKEHWQFMTHDQDEAQVHADVIKKVTKKAAKGFEMTTSIGNLTKPVAVVVTGEDGSQTKLILCSTPKKTATEPDECPATKDGKEQKCMEKVAEK